MKSRFLALHYPKLTVAAASYSTGAKWGAAGTTAQLSMLHQVGGGDRWKKGGERSEQAYQQRLQNYSNNSG